MTVCKRFSGADNRDPVGQHTHVAEQIAYRSSVSDNDDAVTTQVLAAAEPSELKRGGPFESCACLKRLLDEPTEELGGVEKTPIFFYLNVNVIHDPLVLRVDAQVLRNADRSPCPDRTDGVRMNIEHPDLETVPGTGAAHVEAPKRPISWRVVGEGPAINHAIYWGQNLVAGFR